MWPLAGGYGPIGQGAIDQLATEECGWLDLRDRRTQASRDVAEFGEDCGATSA